MLKILKSFALWFIWFGLSFLVESWGWAEQGKAFLIIELVVIGLGMMINLDVDGLEEWLLLALIYVVIIVITLFATWVVTKLFDVDYYVAYQIMSFGQCLYSLSKKDD